MKCSVSLLAISLVHAGRVSNARSDKMADNGDGTFTNPLLWGD